MYFVLRYSLVQQVPLLIFFLIFFNITQSQLY